jgi:hypothetical protein
MKAMSLVFVVLAAALFVGCSEDKPKPTAEPAKPAAAAPASAAPAAPAKAPEKKEEGGW